MTMPRIEVQVGADTTQADAGLDRVKQGLHDVDAAARKAGKSITAGGSKPLVKYGQQAKVASHHTANLTSQFNDIGMMLAAGQSPLMLAMQQGTQVSEVFQRMGGTGKLAFGGIMSGLKAMISPMSLITIGSIAGGAALFQWARGAISAGEEAMTFKERLESVDEALKNYDVAMADANMSTDEMMKKFGSANVEMQSTLDLLRMIAENEAQRAIDGLSKSLSELMGTAGDGDRRQGLASFFDVNIGLAFTDVQREAREEARLLTAEFSNQQTVLQNSVGDIEAQIAATERMLASAQSLAEATGDVSAEEEAIIKQLAESLVLMRKKLGTTVEQVQVSAVFLDLVRRTSDAEREVGENMEAVVVHTAEAAAMGELLKAGISASVVQAMQLSDIDVASGIDSAAMAAAKMATNLGISLQTARDIVAIGGEGVSGPDGAIQQGRSVIDGLGSRENGMFGVVSTRSFNTNNGPDSGSSGGSGGSESRGHIESLIESLATEDEILEEWYATSQENLAEASRQELDILGGQANAKLRLEEEYQRKLLGLRSGYHGTGLQQAETFFGEMAGAMQGGTEKMMRIAKVFGAAEALINSYRAYTQVMADPTLPWFAKIPAAVSVMSAGLGMVSAIKGVSAGGGGGGRGASAPAINTSGGSGFGGSSGGSSSGGDTGSSGASLNRSITIIGESVSSRQAENIAKFMNEGTQNGLTINGRRA